MLLVYDDAYEAEFVAAALDPDPRAAATRPVQVETRACRRAWHQVSAAIFSASRPSSCSTSIELDEQDWSALQPATCAKGAGWWSRPGT